MQSFVSGTILLYCWSLTICSYWQDQMMLQGVRLCVMCTYLEWLMDCLKILIGSLCKVVLWLAGIAANEEWIISGRSQLKDVFVVINHSSRSAVYNSWEDRAASMVNDGGDFTLFVYLMRIHISYLTNSLINRPPSLQCIPRNKSSWSIACQWSASFCFVKYTIVSSELRETLDLSHLC